MQIKDQRKENNEKYDLQRQKYNLKRLDIPEETKSIRTDSILTEIKEEFCFHPRKIVYFYRKSHRQN